jgi:lysozyme family protein
MDALFAPILIREGGFVDNPADKGGPTNYGITLATYAAWLGRDVAVDELKAMPPETAVDIFRKKYFTDPGLNKLPEMLQPIVLDAAVHHGPKGAIKILQEALHISPDGILGPLTVQSAQSTGSDRLLCAHFLDQRIQAFAGICQGNPTQLVFLKGWLRRVTDQYRSLVG